MHYEAQANQIMHSFFNILFTFPYTYRATKVMAISTGISHGSVGQGMEKSLSFLLEVTNLLHTVVAESFITLTLKPGYNISAIKKTIAKCSGSFITLTLKPGYKIGPTKKPVTKRKAIILRPKRDTPYTNKHKFAFGEDLLGYHSLPTQKDIKEVAEILKKERPTLLANAAATDTAANPIHGGTGITIDSVVRVIASQASTNEQALDSQQTMIRAYPYYVNGAMVFGKKPNYHAMRQQSLTKLKTVLRKSGLGNLKAEGIKKCLDYVFEKNMSLREPGQIVHGGNEPDASDFVPGMLSLDYLLPILETGGKQALFDALTDLPLIGIKSACCLMSFSMDLPVFAVDTHVAGMAKLLG